MVSASQREASTSGCVTFGLILAILAPFMIASTAIFLRLRKRHPIRGRFPFLTTYGQVILLCHTASVCFLNMFPHLCSCMLLVVNTHLGIGCITDAYAAKGWKVYYASQLTRAKLEKYTEDRSRTTTDGPHALLPVEQQTSSTTEHSDRQINQSSVTPSSSPGSSPNSPGSAQASPVPKTSHSQFPSPPLQQVKFHAFLAVQEE